MTRFSIVRRTVVLTLLATLAAVSAVVVAATPAGAAGCTGKVSNDPASVPGSLVVYIYATGGAGVVTAGGSKTGTLDNAITSFRTRFDRPVRIDYYNLADRNRYITTHTLQWGSTFSLNPCHWAHATIL